MKPIKLLIILILIINGCVDPYHLDTTSLVERLVVDGAITDTTGPYLIKLYYSRDLSEYDKSKIIFESGASVSIESDKGERELLAEVDTLPGRYLSSIDGIRGQIGTSYQLKIVTESGQQYESSVELMEPAGTIDDFYYEFEPDMILHSPGKIYDSYDGFRVFADASSSEESKGLLRWRWTGVYTGISAPEGHTKFVGQAEIPDPLPCSGYVIGSRGLEQVADCTCCLCWAHEYSRLSAVSDNTNIKANHFLRVPVAQIPITRPRFHERYYVELEQLSVSEGVYNFWKLASEQQRATGSLFQPNSVRIKGNIRSVSNLEEEVLGVFSVSAVVKKSLFINRGDIPYEISEMDPQPYDCRDALPNAITTKPDFW